MRGAALLFGLNYEHCSEGKLSGCINDTANVKRYLRSRYRIPVYSYNDRQDRKHTTRKGMLSKLRQMANLSRKRRLKMVWIHYSGHGTWARGGKGETDGRTELLVPSDCESGARIKDDEINRILKGFWKRTRVFCVFDCCHSGTIADLRYSWRKRGKKRVENRKCKMRNRVVAISGCRDDQTAADAFGLEGRSVYTGAMTTSLLSVLRRNPRIRLFTLLTLLRRALRMGGFSQIPVINSTFRLKNSTTILR